MWWNIFNEVQYLQLRTKNQPKIFIWLTPSLNDVYKTKLINILSAINRKFKIQKDVIISLVDVNRDPMLQDLLNHINPSHRIPFVTGYLANGATYFKSHEFSTRKMEKLICELLLFPHN
ncbi:hypothetical protein BMS3Abin05_00500 [bacterium BMS3Abin05]|nr:hypothetical protein BMS3Abin05_00500 [bacterium BMS3Abin05]GBE28052.1 hypothetical protein BMS3Bbin03_01988 [bacterium BMS3Bbin03]HDZ11014.1 hypothetical protein [Bacteroidota bacterium]